MSWDEVKHRFDIYVDGTPNYFSDYIILDGGITNPIYHIFRDDVAVNAGDEISRRLQSFWFLELATKEGPAGLVLVANEDFRYNRIAYFRLGSYEALSNQAIEYDLGGGSRKQPREWGWEDGLHVKTITIN